MEFHLLEENFIHQREIRQNIRVYTEINQTVRMRTHLRKRKYFENQNKISIMLDEIFRNSAT